MLVRFLPKLEANLSRPLSVISENLKQVYQFQCENIEESLPCKIKKYFSCFWKILANFWPKKSDSFISNLATAKDLHMFLTLKRKLISILSIVLSIYFLLELKFEAPHMLPRMHFHAFDQILAHCLEVCIINSKSMNKIYLVQRNRTIEKWINSFIVHL